MPIPIKHPPGKLDADGRPQCPICQSLQVQTYKTKQPEDGIPKRVYKRCKECGWRGKFEVTYRVSG